MVYDRSRCNVDRILAAQRGPARPIERGAMASIAQNSPGHRSPVMFSVQHERDTRMGFFGALFDFSFTEFVTSKIITFIYALSVIGVALGYIVSVIGGFAQGFLAGVGALIVGGIIALLILAYIRVALEFFMILFRIYENTRLMVNQGYPHHNGAAPSPPPYQPPAQPSGAGTPGFGPQAQP